MGYVGGWNYLDWLLLLLGWLLLGWFDCYLFMGSCQNNGNGLNQLNQAEEDQAHLVIHWKNLPSIDKRRTFQQQLNKVNVNEAIKIYKRHSRASTSRSSSLASSTESDHATGFSEYRPLPEHLVITRSQIMDRKVQLDGIGCQAIRNGEVAVFVMAASHNPELDFDVSIGMYDIGLDSACNIFHILIAKLLKLNAICQAEESNRIKVYIMTSVDNKNEIKNYFKSQDYFGYRSSNIFFFSQPVQPVVDQQGKIMLKTQDKIYLAPRGNGSIYSQIKDKKLLEHLQSHGIKYTFLCPINNLLLKIGDPCTLGYLIKEHQEVVATCVQSKDQCFGYFGMDRDNKFVKVYEDRIANPNKKWANTGSCVMTLGFLKQVVENSGFLEQMYQNLHDMVKLANVFNTSLNTKVLQKCLFFESFYHQAFQLTSKIAIIQINPQSQFAPIRNNSKGKHSLTSTKQSLWNWHRKLIQNLGVKISGEGHLQIHPSLSYDGEDLQKVLKQKQLIEQIKLPAYIH